MRDYEVKLARVRAMMAELGLDAAVFTTQANFAWLTGGGDSHVGLATEAGNAAIVVTRERVFILADNIEAPRVEAEEAAALGLEVLDYPWWEGALEARITALAGSDDWAADAAMGERGSIEPAMYAVRAPLTEQEVADYRTLGKLTGLVLQEAADGLEPGMSEFQAAGLLARGIFERGALPGVILVAADERIARFRHPIPTAKAIERCCLLVVGVRWKGLVCSCSRMVHFGRVPDELARRHEAVCRVDAALIAATVPGEMMCSALKAGIRAYAEAGFENEWLLHHQGGPTGYKGREMRVTPSTNTPIIPFQAFAWNPSISGTKSEDTIIAMEPAPEVVSVTPQWPVLEVEHRGFSCMRPAILVK